jgi:hypothetical protein
MKMNEIKILLPLRVYPDNEDFPKNSSFFHIFFFDQANDVYVEIYETAQGATYVLCFSNQKTEIHVSVEQISTLALNKYPH